MIRPKASHPESPAQADSPTECAAVEAPFTRVPRWWVLSVVVVIAVVTAGFGYFMASQFRAGQRAVEKSLRSVAELKRARLVAWQRERLGDAAVVAELPGLAEAIRQLSATPGSPPPRLQEIDALLNAARRAYGYREIHLLDRSLRHVRRYPVEQAWDGLLSQENRERLLRDNGAGAGPEPVLIDDLHRDANGLVAMHLLVRIRSSSGELAGAVVLSIAAESGLFSHVQSWPVESATAETLLLRREGDSILCLSPLRHDPDAALRVRRPYSSPDLLEAKALRGEAGTLVMGKDYRGEPAVGLALPVSGTPWVMVAKMARSEADAAAWREIRLLAASWVLLVLLLWLSGRFWLQQRWGAHVRRMLEVERRAHELEIQRLDRLYRVISSVNQVLVRAKSRADLLRDVCRVLVERGGFRIAWVGWCNQATKCIEPIAAAGDTTGYVEGIRIVTDPDLPEGCGPSGTAFRDGRVYVCNDFFADANTVPWRERARQAGFKSTIALPLQQEGETLGLLTVYAAEKDFFLPPQIEQLRETAEDISFALGVFAREQRRRAAEAALRSSEGRLQFLVSATPAIIYSRRAGGDFATTFISPNIQEVLGYEAAAVVADPGFWAARVHPDDAATAMAQLGNLESRAPVSREYRFRHADGSWRWMHDAMRVTRDGQGRATELVGYWFDVTERKAAEASLKAREEIFSSIVAQAADAIALVDVATGRFIEFNHAAHEGLGYSRDEFAAFEIGDIQADHSADEIRRNITLIVKEGGAIFESRHRRRDGDLRDVRVSARLLRLQGRDCIAAVWSDITEVKRAEAELRKLSLAVQQSPATIVITDLAGVIEYVNPRFTELTGYSAAEVIGQNPRVLKSGLTDPGVYADLWRTITGGRVWRGEIINRKKSGETFVELCIVTPVKDAQGRSTHFVALKEDITARLKNEQKLRQLSRTIEQAPFSIAITDLSGAIEYVNPAFLAITGYALPEVLGQNPRVLKSGFTSPEIYEEMWRTLTRGEVWRGELVNKKKNGDVYHERAVIAPVADETGQVTHYVALKEDISERKRAEAALRESELRYRELFDLESDAIMLLEADSGRIIRANQAAGVLYGWSPAELEQMRNVDVSAEPALTLQMVAPEIREAGRVTRVPQRLHRRRDGSVFPVEISLRFFERDGRWLYLAAIRDITLQVAARETLQRFNAELEQKVAQRTEELAARTRQMQALLDAIPDTVMLVRTDGTILLSQPARQGAGELAAITPRQGVTPAPGASAEMLAANLALGRSALAKGTIVIGESEIATPGGKLCLELRTAPTGPDEFVVFARDITARKNLEAETALMLEKERQVSEMKTRFISVTSHEFRTPMTAAMGTAELLTNHFDRLAPAKRLELLSRITFSLQRMAEMLDEVLLLSRMDSKRVGVNLVAVNLQRELEVFIDEIKLGDRGAHHFDLQVSGAVGEFYTDRNLLHHIGSNLLSNAARYSPNDSTVTVRLVGDPEQVRLIVQDQGIGIPEGDRTRIFEPFERGSNVGNIKGTGLGLNIVKRMTEMLGGTIAVEPVAPAGSCFTLVLPRRPEPPASP